MYVTRIQIAARSILGLVAVFVGTTVAYAADAPAAKPWYERITVKGYVQVDAIFPQGNAVQGPYSNFRIRRARPTIIAPLDDLTRVQVQVDAGSGKAGSGQSTVIVTDTFAERSIQGLGLVRVGQYLLPFGSEIYEDNAALRSPLELSFAAESIALAERDIGITLQSSPNPADRTHWAVAVFNGQGFRSADGNANKTIVGRIAQDLCPEVRVGVSGILGSYTAVDKKEYDRHVLGVELHAKTGSAGKLTGEFYNARFVNSTTSATPSAARFNGGYLLFEGNVPSLKSFPFVRYQRTYGDIEYRSIDIGWRYQYSPNQRLVAEYDFVKGHQRDSFGVRWQLGF